MSELFRKQSLERLRSPEQLDQLMHVTSSKAWLILLSLMLFVAGSVAWGFFGRVATRVGGEGILIKSGGVLDVV